MECIWDVAAALGEGPLWDAASGTLWFVDIKRGHVHRLHAESGVRESFDVGGSPSFIVPANDGGYVIGNRHALQRFDGARIQAELARVEMPAGNRLNDATVDRRGRLWFGSMDDGERDASGRVHVYDGGRIVGAGGECVITNGPAVTEDARMLYHVDTLGGLIWRFDIGAGVMLGDGIVFARIDPADGTPDGVTLDAEGHLWVGLWGGWAARRYAPDGALVATVEFPCANVTKIAFGGPDLRTAFATTARIGLDEAGLRDQPLAGGLFAFPVDVPGLPLPAVRIA
jgi:D-xylonolactonase